MSGRDGLEGPVSLAVAKLGGVEPAPVDPCVLVLIDADDQLPCVLGPTLERDARRVRSDADVACVIANPEFETWFVASAESLSKYLDPGPIPSNPEDESAKKRWVQRRFRGHYGETVDQPRLTATMDLGLCRQRSPSFDKLCRVLESRWGAR